MMVIQVLHIMQWNILLVSKCSLFFFHLNFKANINQGDMFKVTIFLHDASLECIPEPNSIIAQQRVKFFHH